MYHKKLVSVSQKTFLIGKELTVPRGAQVYFSWMLVYKGEAAIHLLKESLLPPIKKQADSQMKNG